MIVFIFSGLSLSLLNRTSVRFAVWLLVSGVVCGGAMRLKRSGLDFSLNPYFVSFKSSLGKLDFDVN